MAGATKIRKDIILKLNNFTDYIKKTICAGTLTIEETHRAEDQLKQWWSQYHEITTLVIENHAYWREHEKIAKIEKISEELKEMVEANFVALSKYALSSTFTTARLAQSLKDDAGIPVPPDPDPDPGGTQTIPMQLGYDPEENVPVTSGYDASLPPPPSALLADSVRQSVREDPTMLLQKELAAMRLQQKKVESLLSTIVKEKESDSQVTRLSLKKHDEIETPRKRLTFHGEDDDVSYAQRRVPPPTKASTPAGQEYPYATNEFDSASMDLYMNTSLRRRQVAEEERQFLNLREDPVKKTDRELLEDSLIEHMKKRQHIAAPSFKNTTLSAEESTRHFSRIPLPKFKGDKVEFESWWAAFKAVVDSSTLPDGVKMLKLLDCLEKEPYDAVKDYGFTTLAYTLAKEKLEKKYGGCRRKLAIRWEEMNEFRPMKDDNAAEMEKFSEVVDRLVLSLYEQGEKAELGSGTLYHTLLRKLTSSCVHRFQRWLYEQHKVGDVLSLREYVGQEALFLTSATEAVSGFKTGRRGKEKRGSGTFTANSGVKKGPNREGRGPERKNVSMNARGVNEKNESKRKWVCKVCSAEHGLWECARFLRLPVPKRKEKVKEIRACEKCLQNTHPTDKCYRKRGCTIEGCQDTHHYLLHDDGPIATSDQSPRDTSVKQTYHQSGAISTDTESGVLDKQTPSMHQDTGKKQTDSSDMTRYMAGQTYMSADKPSVMTTVQPEFTVLFRTVPIYLCAGGKRIKVNAFLDEGSDRSYMTQDVAGHLHLQGPVSLETIGSVNNQTIEVRSQEVQCELMSIDKRISRIFVAKTLPSISENLRATRMVDHKHRWKHLHGITFPEPAGRNIDVLIGVDYSDLICGEIPDIVGGPGEPVAKLTPLGWTCAGRVPHVESAQRPQVFITHTHYASKPVTTNQVDPLNELVKKAWEIDAMPVTTIVNPEEKRAIEVVKRTMQYRNGRYVVGLPWRFDDQRPKNNFKEALKRFLNTEKRLKKDMNNYHRYNDVIVDYKVHAYVRKKLWSCIYEDNCCFLPHFPIIREHVETTKVRPVYDASAEFMGISLNDLLLPGPKLQKDIVVILIRFRRFPVGLSSDVKQMYLQIEVMEEDCPYQRFIWRDLDTGELVIYEFTRVVFGLNCSPFLAQMVVQEHASKYMDSKPDGANMIKNSTYMDDGLDSSFDVETARKRIRETREIYQDCGMNVHKWVSNSPEALSELDPSELAKEVDITRNMLPQAKALGQGWFTLVDMLNYATKKISAEEIKTKRLFLRALAGLFDPLGLASPLLIRGKILLQRCWESGYDWDESLPCSLLRDIHCWIEDLKYLETIQLPRVLIPYHLGIFQLHVFSDSSDDAYGAVIFIRNWIPGQTPWVNLVLSKAKVAPLASVSTPRLELVAATMGSTMIEKVREALDVGHIECYHWTDSQDVLYWIAGHSRDFRPFVANRVGTIQRKTDPKNWGYINTKENPADLLSRGVAGKDFDQATLWWKGATFLENSTTIPEKWKPHASSKALRERKKNVGMTFVSTENKKRQIEIQPESVELKAINLHPERFSGLNRFLGILGYVLRAKLCFAGKRLHEARVLTASEFWDAETCAISYAQKRCYNEERRALLGNKSVPMKSEIALLSPWLDENGLIRGRSRLERSEEIPWDIQYPILLSRHEWLAFLYARDYHESKLHCGPNMVATLLQQRFWIPGIRILSRQVVDFCMKCRRTRARTLQPQMGPLPPCRLDGGECAFKVTSTDFAGPFYTKAGRGRPRHKRYMCIFVCAHTRAVHIEMVFDMGAEAFLMAFTRFRVRRGVLAVMISDNGSNYQRASKDLREFIACLDYDVLQDKTRVLKMTWKFNPPAAPHFNGLHEILVQAAKRGVYRVLEGADITDEELFTVFAEVEGMLNSRPITVRSSHPEDFQPLTPSHFLTGRMPVPMPHELLDFDDEVKYRWRHVQHLSGQIWRRWHDEWITALSPRSKWIKGCRNLKEGDIVLLADKDMPRYTWKLGRIFKIYPGTDGIVRVVDVQVGPTVYRRPVVKLSYLTE